MFKSIFKKNKRPTDQGIAFDQSTERQQSLTNDKDEVLKRFFESVKPSFPAHAEEYAVPVVEIERLWSRFQQLGPDEQGSLPDNLFQLYPYTTDPFVRQIWRIFPRDNNENVSFHSFVGVFMWWKTVSLDKKLRGIFKLLNGSQPLDVPALQQIILKLENTSDENAATSKAELFVKKLDSKEQGFIDEDQWVTWISQLPEDEISKLTKFSIIPPEIGEYSSSRQSSEVLPESQSTIPNEVLVNLVSKIGEKDWTQLAQELGFNEREIRMVKKRFPHRSREQVYQMLLLWQQKMGGEATITAVNFALQNSGIEDFPELLHQ